MVRSRALEAGRLLAAVLLSRPVGSRPVTLLGFSMGAKVNHRLVINSSKFVFVCS